MNSRLVSTVSTGGCSNTGVDQALIAEAARLYATADGAIIPWTPITDMQIVHVAIRLHSILRAVTSNLDVEVKHWWLQSRYDFRVRAGTSRSPL